MEHNARIIGNSVQSSQSVFKVADVAGSSASHVVTVEVMLMTQQMLPPLTWWKMNPTSLPAWFAATKQVLLIQP